METFSQNLVNFLGQISTNFGSGVLVNDIMLFLLLLGFVTFLFAVAAYRHTFHLKTPPGLERVNAIAGKVEKVEMNLNEFRIETVRNLELFRGDLGYIKQELAQISGMIKILSKNGGSQNLAEASEFGFKSGNPANMNQSWENNETSSGLSGTHEDDLPPNPLSQDSNKKKV